MIRINLLAVEREAKKKKATFQAGQKVTLACGLILVLTAAIVGWRYYELSRESAKLDGDITAAQEQTSRLHGIIHDPFLCDRRSRRDGEPEGNCGLLYHRLYRTCDHPLFCRGVLH